MKTGSNVYCSMLDMVIEQLNDTIFESHNLHFQQDSALENKVKQMQTCLTKHISDLITLSKWLTVSLAGPQPIGL